MKFIYKTKNLALTALVGAALAMGTPAAMAQTVDDNVTPTPSPEDQTSNGSYEEDLALLNYYLEFVKYEGAKYQDAYPDLYAEVFAPTVDEVIKQIEEMIGKVKAANEAAEADDEAEYVSPITEEFKEELFKEFKELSANAIYIKVGEEQEKVQALSKSLLDEIELLSESYKETVASEVTNADAEAFFLDEKDSDAIVAKLQAMEGEIAKAAEHAQQVDFEKFDSPVTDEWINEIKSDIQKFKSTCQERIATAEKWIAAHDGSVDTAQALEEDAQKAMAEVIENAKAVLGEEIEFNEEEEDFFKDEPDFDPVLKAIEEYFLAMSEVAAAAQKANWQSYDSAVLEEKVAEFEAAVADYKEKAEGLVNNAKTMLQQHDEDVEYIDGLEKALAAAQETITEKYNAVVGEDSEVDTTDEELITNAAAYVAIQDKIEKLRAAMLAETEKAAADHWQSYSQEASGVEEAVYGIEQEIAQYQQDGLDRIDNALNTMAQHDKDIDVVTTAENDLAQKLEALQTLYTEKLESELGEPTDEAEEFFYDEKKEESLQTSIDGMRKKIGDAYEKAVEDNMSHYNSPIPENWVALFNTQLQEYYDECEYRINNAQAQWQLHDEDVDHIVDLETALAAAHEAIVKKYNETLGEDTELDEADEALATDAATYLAIQAKIEKLREAMVAEAEKAAAGYWQEYSPEATGIVASKHAIEQEIAAYEEAGLDHVGKALDAVEKHDADVALLTGLENDLAAALQTAQAAYAEKLESELGEPNDEQEAFFYDEEEFNALQKVIEDERAKVADAYEATQKANLGSYESPLTEEMEAEFAKNLQKYIDTTETRINRAQAMLQQHTEDTKYISGLEDELAAAQEAISEKYNALAGDDVELSDEEIAQITDAATFEAIQAKIEELRKTVVAAYDKAAADNWQSYDQEETGVELAVAGIEEEIAAYQEAGINHVETVLNVINAHDANIATLTALESKLMEAVQAAQALYAEKLEAELGEPTEEQEAFFYDEETFQALQTLIDTERGAVVEAYEKAVADNYQGYESPITEEWLAEAQAKIQDYADQCEYRVLNAQAQLQLFEEDLELIQALDSELLAAATKVQNQVMEVLGVDELTDEEEAFFLNEKAYEALSAEIDALRSKAVEAYDEAAADNWQNYSQEASGVKEQAQELYEAIQSYAEQCEYRANNAQAQMQLHDEDVDLIQALDGELYNAVVGIQEVMQEKLGEEIEISDEMAEFFQDEETFDALQAQIDALRQSAAAAYEKAEADNWQNYDQEASGVKEHGQEIYEAIVEYKDECEFRVNNAQANIQLHGEDAEMYYDLSAALQAAFDEVATEADDNIDADILEGIRDYLVVDGYDAVLAQIDALQAAMVKQYEVAEADNWQKYEQQIVPNATSVDEAIAQYKEESGARVLKALASIEAHQYDLDVLLPLDEMLGDGIAELMEEHPELFEEGSEFIDQYEALSAQIEEIWKEIAAAATEAEEDNWQSYKSVCANSDVQSLYTEVEDFLAMAWGDTGTINLHRWDADNDAVIALESALVAAVESIQQNNPDYNVDPEFDAIQAAIDALRHKMADAYEAAEAEAWESYECPYTQADLDAVEAMIGEMVAHSQGTSAIEGVNAENEQPMIFSIDGKRLSAPVKGELNIFIYKNRVEKKIVK